MGATKIQRLPQSTSDFEWTREVYVPRMLVAQFARQLSILFRSGVPLVQALVCLSAQPDSPKLAQVVDTLVLQVSTGHRLSHACSRFPRVFPQLFTVMLKVGEQSGSLDSCLFKLADWLEADEALVRSLKSALSYPLIVLGASLLLTLLVFYTVLPGFVQIFASMQIPLPLCTRVLLGVSQAAHQPWVWLIGVMAAEAVHLYSRRLIRTQEGRSHLFRILLSVPLVAALLRTGTLARYCTAASTLLQSGVDLVRALQLAAEVSGNPLILEDSRLLIQAISNGERASHHMTRHQAIYPGCLRYMVAAGEEASKMPALLQNAAALYDLETQSRLQILKAALEPILLCGLAFEVGAILLSVFIPMYGYISKL